jgi:hypothetical protein
MLKSAPRPCRVLVGAAIAALTSSAGAQALRATDALAYSWQKPNAKAIGTGDPEWASRPFEFEHGPSVRYLDFDAGDDANEGTSKDRPWEAPPRAPAQRSGARHRALKRRAAGAANLSDKRPRHAHVANMTIRGRKAPPEQTGRTST